MQDRLHHACLKAKIRQWNEQLRIRTWTLVQKLGCLPADRIFSRIEQWHPIGIRLAGRPFQRWLDDIKSYLMTIKGAGNWKSYANQTQLWIRHTLTYATWHHSDLE